MLGSIDRAHVLRLLAALAKQDGAALLAEVEQLDESAPDYGAVLDELLEALQRIAVLQLVGGRSDDEEFAAVAPFADAILAGGRAALLSNRVARPPGLARCAASRAWASR